MDYLVEIGNMMIARAKKDGLPEDHIMYTDAHAFNAKAAIFYGDAPDKCTVGTFTKFASKAAATWNKYTGETIRLMG